MRFFILVSTCVREEISFDLVGLYGISTIIGYSMPNPLCTYILNI